MPPLLQRGFDPAARASRGVQEQMVPAPSHEKSQGGQGRGDGNHRVGCGAEPVTCSL